MKVVVHVDGGSRGNPGPAAGAAVIRAPNGELLAQASELLGVATNNVAEYRGLLLGLRRASELGATEVELINDSELVAKQLSGLLHDQVQNGVEVSILAVQPRGDPDERLICLSWRLCGTGFAARGTDMHGIVLVEHLVLPDMV